MQVFKLYFKLLKSVAPALMLYGIVFVVLSFINSSVQGQKTIAYQQEKIETAIVNYNEDSIFVQDMLDYLSEFCEFQYYGYSENELSDALFFRKVTYILTIPHDFGEDFLLGKDVSIKKKSVPDGIYAITVDNAINKYLNTARTYKNMVPDITEKELISYIRKDISMEVKVAIEQKESSSNYNFYNNYFNTLAYIMLAGCILCIGMIMLSIQNVHVHRRNIVAPISTRNMDIQLIGGNLIFVLGFDFLFILFGVLFNKDKSIDGNILLFWINTIVFSISVLAISYLVALSVKRKRANNAISIVLSLGLSFISGAFVPQYLLGDAVLKLASFTPVYWFVKGNNMIADLTEWNASNLRMLFNSMAIQIGFAAAIFSLSMVISKNRSQKEQ